MTTQKWGGFQRSFTRMGDRDPNPGIPFVTSEPFPLPSKSTVAVSLAVVILLGALASWV